MDGGGWGGNTFFGQTLPGGVGGHRLSSCSPVSRKDRVTGEPRGMQRGRASNSLRSVRLGDFAAERRHLSLEEG